jgi:TRAP-type mannitol/chloroaromatic compound transport system permease small subunit
MRFIISLVLIIGFCVLLLVGLLSVLQDLFARSAHQQPSIPAPKPARRHDGSLSDGQSLSGV